MTATNEGIRLTHTLADLISDSPPDPRAVLPLFVRILEYIDSIHAAGKYHMPLTPESIHVGDLGEVYVRSYHLAESNATMAFSGARYSAPEAFRRSDGERNCARSDVYILGFIFYEVLLGRALFRREFDREENAPPSAWLIWHTNLNFHPRPLTELITGFPATIAQVVERMLQKDPEKRISGLQQIASIFLNSIDKTTIAQTTVNRRAPEPPGKQPKARKRETAEKGDLAILSAFIGPIRKQFCHYFRSCRVSLPRPHVPQYLRIAEQVKVIRQFVRGRHRTAPLTIGLASVAALFASILVLHGRTSLVSPTQSNSSPQVEIVTDTGPMILIQGGEIRMAGGGNYPHDARSIFLPSFYMDQREVTNRDYLRFCADTGRACAIRTSTVDIPEQVQSNPNSPVVNVSLADARAFAVWAGKYLPSPVEWQAVVQAPNRKVTFRLPGLIGGATSFEWLDAGVRDSLDYASAENQLLDTSIALNAQVSENLRSPANSKFITFRCAAESQIVSSSHLLRR